MVVGWVLENTAHHVKQDLNKMLPSSLNSGTLYKNPLLFHGFMLNKPYSLAAVYLKEGKYNLFR